MSYVFHEATIAGVRELGFPDSFRIQLAVLKALGALVLVLPITPQPLREWAYAGIALFVITALVAHAAHGDPLALALVNVAFLILLGLSRWSWAASQV